MSYEIVPYRPAFQRGVARLHTEMWSRDLRRNADYLKWKYQANPFGAPFWVALHDGEVVGTRGAIGLGWRQRRAAAVQCLSASDAMVHADHRRQGLFTAMNEAMLQALGPAVPPFINLSSHASSAAGYAAQGWSSVGSWQVAFRRLAPRRRHTLAPGQRGQPTPFAVLDIHARGELPGPISVSSRPRPGAMARLAARLSSGAPLGLDRSRRFYAWRYGNPLSRYRILFLGTRRLRGFMALQFSIRSACAAINVVEWEGESARDKALLIEAAMTWGDFDSLRIWSASFTPDEQALLARLGFAVVDHAGAAAEGFYCPQILVRPAERGGTRGLARSLGQLAQWQLPGIASDNF